MRLPPLLAATLLAVPVLTASGAQAFDPEAMTDAERAAFRAEVRAYLLDNPEVLMEAIGVLEAREAQAQAEADTALAELYAAAIADDGFSWVGGNPDGDITVVEFMDYRCGYCRRAVEAIEGLVADDGNVRFVLKELPILGEQSLLAAQFAIAVHVLHGDDAYKDAHDALMAMTTDVTPASLSRLAEGFGLDPAPILAEMAGPEVSRRIEATRALAQGLQISGTPTFVFGNRLVRGAVPREQMELVLAEQRAAAE